MERLNSNYNLDCYSDSELDSESKENSIDMNMAMKHSYEFLKPLLQKHYFRNATCQSFL